VFPVPATPAIYTLSLHDALPICVDIADCVNARYVRFHFRVDDDAVFFDLQSPIGNRTKFRNESVVANDCIYIDPFHVFPARLLRSEEHTSELQSRENLVCRLLLE